MPSGASFVKPDIVAWRDHHPPVVLDVQICGDDNSELAYEAKVDKYSAVDADLCSFLTAVTSNPVTSVLHRPLIITFRGVISRRSLSGLRELSLTDLDASDLCLLALSGSARVSAIFFGGT